jgi:hypothetical protein
LGTAFKSRSDLGVVESNFCHPVHAGLVVDCAVLVEQTTVSVVGVLAQTHVGGDGYIRELLPDELGSENYGCNVAIGMSPTIILKRKTVSVKAKRCKGTGVNWFVAKEN